MKEVCLVHGDVLVEATLEGCDEEFSLRPELSKIAFVNFTQVCGNCVHYSVQGWPGREDEG